LRLRNLLNQGTAKALVRRQLVPGRVILYPMDFGNEGGPEPKYVILSAKRDDYFLVFVINSSVHPYIALKPHLNNQQVDIDRASHTEFLVRDSKINCSKLRPLLIADVENHLAKNPDHVKTVISDKVRAEILRVVGKYGVLSDVEKQAVADYLGA
jgi:hypothetical protein